METQHTESPWKVVELPAKSGIPATHEIQFGEDGECVAEWVHKKEDAKLIAAAPDMLRALIEIEGEVCDDDANIKILLEIIDRVKKIAYETIKKATE